MKPTAFEECSRVTIVEFYRFVQSFKGLLIVTPEVMNKGLRTQRVSQFDQLSVGDVFAALS